MSPTSLRVLYAAAEVAPFAKTGGLADVAGALPQALARLGHDVRVVMPRHRGVEAAAGPLRVAVPRVAVPIGDRTVEATILEGRLGDRVPVYFVAHEGYYDRPALYGASDDCERFVFFCRSVLAALPALGWMPHVVHANDWQAGLLPVYLETLYRDTPEYADVATVFTVHNLAYQGIFWHYDLPMMGLGWDLFTPAGIEFYGHLSLLKGGLVFADLLTTVSPTYAREIQTPEFGERMDGVLRERSADLVGILNGLDVEVWNPATDPDLPKRYDRDDPGGKAACTSALRDEMGLPDPGRPDPARRGGEPARRAEGDRPGRRVGAGHPGRRGPARRARVRRGAARAPAGRAGGRPSRVGRGAHRLRRPPRPAHLRGRRTCSSCPRATSRAGSAS